MKNPSKTHEAQGVSFSISLSAGEQTQAGPQVPGLKLTTGGIRGGTGTG